MNKIFIILLLMISTNVFAFSLFGAKNYDECILEEMKGVTSDQAAKAIMVACAKKFYPQKKKIECKSEQFTSLEMSQLNATGGVQSWGYFNGNVYNGSNKTIRSIFIEYKITLKSKPVVYKIENLEIAPLSSGDFSTSVHEKTPAVEWDFVAYGCD